MPDLGFVDPEAPADIYGRAAASIVEDELVDDNELWLLGHSAGGLFLPWIVRHLGELPIAGLIYLAAYVPTPGESLLSTLSNDPSMFHSGWIGANPMDDHVAEQYLFHDCPAEEMGKALASRRVMIAKTAMSEVFPDVAQFCGRSEYILCRQDRTLTSKWMRKAAKNRLGTKPLEISSGHCPQTSRPNMLVAMLDALSTSRAAAL